MNPHRLILELVDGPVDEHGLCEPNERWFICLKRDMPNDPWGIQIPIDYGVTAQPTEVLNLMKVAVRYLIHNQPKPFELVLNRISEADWNEVFQCPETKSPETCDWGPEIRSPETGKPTTIWPWRICRTCHVQWELARSGELCPDCGYFGQLMPTRSDSVPMVAYSWSTRPLPHG